MYASFILSRNPYMSTPAATTTTMTATGSICFKCGTVKKSGKLSCCARGGSWFKNCGDSGDSKFEHTWVEGVQACADITSVSLSLKAQVQSMLHNHMSLHSVSRGLLQACTPSTHVCSNFESPESPQFLNQEPPRAQQLSFPDFLMVPHLKHIERVGVAVVVVTAGVDI